MDNADSKQVCVQLPTSADNVALPAAFAAVRAVLRPMQLSAGRAAIDRYLLHAGPRQQTRMTGRTDRQTDGGRQTDPAAARIY